MARGNIRLLGVQAHMYEHGQWIQNGYSTVIDGTQIRSSPADLAPRTLNRTARRHGLWCYGARPAGAHGRKCQNSEIRPARAATVSSVARTRRRAGTRNVSLAARGLTSARSGAGSSSLAFTVLFPCSVIECKVQGSSGDGLGHKTPAIVGASLCGWAWRGLAAALGAGRTSVLAGRRAHPTAQPSLLRFSF
jgi:hypothetical protein